MVRQSFAALAVVCLLAVPILALPAFRSTLQRSQDRVIYECLGDRIDFVISSSSGIGSCTLEPYQGCWPSQVTIHLQYDRDHSFQRLESLGISADHWKIHGHSGQRGPLRRDFSDGSESQVCDVQLDTRDGMHIRLPKGLLSGRQSVHISWVDAFR